MNLKEKIIKLALIAEKRKCQLYYEFDLLGEVKYIVILENQKQVAILNFTNNPLIEVFFNDENPKIRTDVYVFITQIVNEFKMVLQ